MQTKDKNHDERMRAVYEKIYTDCYLFQTDAINYAKKMITKNLAEAEISIDELKTLNVLNVGPCREAKVFADLGAKNVYHFDISDVAVNSLNELKKNGRYTNLHTMATDICIPNSLSTKHKVDFVYLAGVLHHLYNPRQAIKNIFNCISNKSKLFFRIYRSGAFTYYNVEFIRKIIDYSWMDEVYKEAENIKSLQSDIPDGRHNSIRTVLHDDFFVPVIHLFNPIELDNFFNACTFTNINDKDYEKYNHSRIEPWSQGRSQIYKSDKFNNSIEIPKKFPGNTDQLDGISYSEECIKRTNLMMREIIENKTQYSRSQLIKLAIRIYPHSLLNRKTYKKSCYENHNVLQEYLRDL